MVAMQASAGNGNSAEDVAPEETNVPARRAPQQQASRRGYHSIHDYKDEEKDGGDEGQSFYAGGSEHSGNMIVGPPRKDTGKFADDFLSRVRENGAEEVRPEDSASASGSSRFQGSGYRLGDRAGGSGPVDEAQGQQAAKKAPFKMTLKVYKNGFTVNDGELRLYNDRKNATFLNAIMSGVIPQEVYFEHPGQQIELDIVTKKDEDYKTPTKKQKTAAFSGAGYTLGSTASTTDMNVAASSLTIDDQVKSEAANVTVDESKPKTVVQIRLQNGKKLRQEFNQSHTVGDLRGYVLTASPSLQNFILMTTFPNRELKDESQTLVQAKLLNACVVQKKM